MEFEGAFHVAPREVGKIRDLAGVGSLPALHERNRGKIEDLRSLLDGGGCFIGRFAGIRVFRRTFLRSATDETEQRADGKALSKRDARTLANEGQEVHPAMLRKRAVRFEPRLFRAGSVSRELASGNAKKVTNDQ